MDKTISSLDFDIDKLGRKQIVDLNEMRKAIEIILVKAYELHEDIEQHSKVANENYRRATDLARAITITTDKE